MTVRSIWLRRIHKWVGLVIGIQFLIWAISGAAMALLDMEEVAGGPIAEHRANPLPTNAAGWETVQRRLAGSVISNIAVQELPGTTALAATTEGGVRLFDAATGSPIIIDGDRAGAVAAAAHPKSAPIKTVTFLRELPLAVREHRLPIWKVDFNDAANSSYFVSGTTGQLLERRNDSWRWWDFFWMLHNMDYAKRTSFNHPLIIMVGFAAAWLAATGFWLLFRTMWRHDFSAMRRAVGR